MNYPLSIPIDEDNMTNVFKTTTWSIYLPYMKQIQHYNDNDTQDKMIDGISKSLATSRKLNLTLRFHLYNTHMYHIQVQCCCHNNFAMSTKFATTINPFWNTLKFPTFVCYFQGKVHIVMQRQLASLQ
jgi:hypothetical protein